MGRKDSGYRAGRRRGLLTIARSVRTALLRRRRDDCHPLPVRAHRDARDRRQPGLAEIGVLNPSIRLVFADEQLAARRHEETVAGCPRHRVAPIDGRCVGADSPCRGIDLLDLPSTRRVHRDRNVSAPVPGRSWRDGPTFDAMTSDEPDARSTRRGRAFQRLDRRTATGQPSPATPRRTCGPTCIAADSGIGPVRVQPPELLLRTANRTERPAVRRHHRRGLRRREWS